jgi:RNA polymerase sigma-70 factor (ECF subfamily)
MAAVESIDHYLVRQVQQGNKHAFDTLVKKYQRKLSQLVTRYTKDPEEALDIVQEAFIKAYRALPNFRGEAEFYTWLYRIAINTAKNHIGHRSRRPSEDYLEIEDAEQFESAAWLRDQETPEGLALSEELAKAIQRAFIDLPEELSMALSLREFDGLSYDQIAATMHCPVGTVRSRIFRAREAIDAKLEAFFGDGSAGIRQ